MRQSVFSKRWCQSSSIARWWVLSLDWSIHQHDSRSKVDVRFEASCILHAYESEVRNLKLGVFLIQIWDLESKSIVDELKPQFDLKTNNAQRPYCISLQWSADGQTLFSGNLNYLSSHTITYHLWWKCAMLSWMPCMGFKVLTQHTGSLITCYCNLYLQGPCLACIKNYFLTLSMLLLAINHAGLPLSSSISQITRRQLMLVQYFEQSAWLGPFHWSRSLTSILLCRMDRQQGPGIWCSESWENDVKEFPSSHRYLCTECIPSARHLCLSGTDYSTSHMLLSYRALAKQRPMTRSNTASLQTCATPLAFITYWPSNVALILRTCCMHCTCIKVWRTWSI